MLLDCLSTSATLSVSLPCASASCSVRSATLSSYGTKIGRVGRHDVVRERARDGDRLERRARLVREADRAVLLRVGRRAGRVVRVHARPVREREDLARLRVHHDRGRASRAEHLTDAVEHRLDLVLQVRVDRQLDVLPGIVGRSSWIEIGWPSASLTTLRIPSRPRRTRSSPYSKPLPPPGASLAVPSSWDGEPLARVDAPRAGRERDPVEVQLGDPVALWRRAGGARGRRSRSARRASRARSPVSSPSSGASLRGDARACF